MARLPRFVLPEYPQHVIQRGHNAQRILFDEADYWFLWERLGAGAAKFQCDIHAYVLMPTHLHLVVTPHAQDGIGKMMQYVGRYYVQYFNQRYDCTGTLWDGRYRATLIDPSQWLNTCARYVEQNPIRAGLVTEAGAYDWSSHGANCGGREDTLVCPHPAYLALGRSIRARQAAWRTLVAEPLPPGDLERIRSATNKAWVLGDQEFCAEIETKLNRRATPRARGGDRRSAAYRQQAAAAGSAEA
jgi:putative transposase